MKTATITASNGAVATIDAADFDYLSQFRWHQDGYGYFMRRVVKDNGLTTTVRLHREIMNAPTGQYVDHINRDVLDNRRSNLRLCTPAQNQWNVGRRRTNTSGVSGVYFYKPLQKWGVKFKVNEEDKFFGYHDTFEDAVAVRNEAMLKHRGEFAVPSNETEAGNED